MLNMIQGKDYVRIGSWGVITNNRNEILLLRRRGKAKWERPGGRVEVGEMISETLIREVREETGLEAELKELVLFQEITGYDQGEHWIDFCYHAVARGEPRVMEPEVHEEVRWFGFDQLPELSVYTKYAIREYNNICKKN